VQKGSFAKHRLDTEPHRAEKTRDDDADDGLEGETLRLLDAFAPPPQVLEIGAQFAAVFFLDAEGGKYRGDGAINHGIDIVVMDPLLLAKRFRHDGADGLFVEVSHGNTALRDDIGSSFDDPRDILEAAFGEVGCDDEIGRCRCKSGEPIGRAEPEDLVEDQELCEIDRYAVAHQAIGLKGMTDLGNAQLRLQFELAALHRQLLGGEIGGDAF
jgi:hypothetical protein